MSETKNEIQEIYIRKNPTYVETNPGRMVATIKYTSSRGNIEVPMAPEATDRLLQYLLPVLVEFSAQAVKQIAEDISAQIGQLGPTVEAPAITEEASA